MRGIPSLTGIRGLAALWVVFYHLQQFPRQLGAPWLADVPLLPYGWVGVDLFFVLSGFILFYVHEKDFTDITVGKIGEFAILRMLRIYPLSIVVLLLIAGLVLLSPDFAGWYARQATPPNLTYQAFLRTLFLATRWFPPFEGDWNQPVWSVSVEILGYVAFPWLACLVARCRSPGVPVLLASASLALLVSVTIYFLGTVSSGRPYGWGILRMAAAFVAGIAACKAWRLLGDQKRRELFWLADVSAVAVVLSCLVPNGLAFTTAAFVCLISGLALEKGIANAVLSSRPVLFLGKISFPLYLVHVMPLLWLQFQLRSHVLSDIEAVAILCAYLVICVGAAALLHQYVERPCQRLGHRVASGLRRSREPVTETA